MRRLIPVLVSGLFAACAPGLSIGPTLTPEPTPTPDPCAPEVAITKIEEMDEFFTEFYDASDLAGSTPRGSLAPMIADMQAIRRDAERLEMPVCLEVVHEKLIDLMNDMIDAFQSFLANDSDTIVNGKFDDAATSIEAYSTMRERAINTYSVPTPASTQEE